MVPHSSAVRDLLDSANAARASGRGEIASRLYDEAVAICRTQDDLPGWTEAVLGAASVYLFGSEPGKLPAQLYDVLARTLDHETRARLCAALARCWAYRGQVARAVRFADQAIECAIQAANPDLMADCLDAALAAHWGPDELEVRRSLSARLDEVAAHVLNPEVRLQAQLWGLQVACEALDLPSMHRQLRALEGLAEESSRALFFAASRRLMLDLLRGRTDTAAHLVDVAAEAAKKSSLADAWMVVKAMDTYSAAMSGDTVRCAAGAQECETFALAEGVTAVCAEAAFLWTCAGALDRAAALVGTFHGPVLAGLPRDVNWLLTLQCLLEAALAVGDGEVIGQAAGLLAPYEGRAVFNAGAVMFHGVIDDTLSRAAVFSGDMDRAERLKAQALAIYEHLGAQWWRARLASSWRARDAGPEGPRRMHLHPVPGGLWLIGPAENAAPASALRGFGYLRELLRHPGRSMAALDLVGAGMGVVDQGGLGEIIDQQALMAYRQRLRELDDEIAEAGRWSDLGRLGSVQGEREALLKEVARATGLHGRARVGGSSQERARVAVKKSISSAIGRIATIDESAAQHLRSGIRTGSRCSYEPSPADVIEWIVD